MKEIAGGYKDLEPRLPCIMYIQVSFICFFPPLKKNRLKDQIIHITLTFLKVSRMNLDHTINQPDDFEHITYSFSTVHEASSNYLQ